MNRNIVVVIALLVLTGCVTVTQAPMPGARAPQANEGVVVVSITTNSAAVSQFDSIQLTLLKDPKAESGVVEKYILNQATRGLARDTALFVGVMPAGDYQLDRFNDDDTQKFLQLSEGSRTRLGPIRVEAGALNDLGRLVVTPVNFGIMVGRSGTSRSNQELLKRVVPELAAHFERPVRTGWTRTQADENLAERYALEHPLGAAGLTELSNGEVAAATRMGTVLIRATDGRWRRVSSGRLESLLWIKPYENDRTRLLAVGEFNTLLRMNRSGKLQALDTGNLPFGNILFIDGHASAGWFVVLQRGEEITLFQSPSLESPNWQPVRTEKVGRDFWHGATQFWIWPYSGGFAYAVSQGDIHVYDYAARSWSQRRAPGESRLLRIDISPKDVIGIVTSPGGGFGGVFSKTYYSRDLGQTWIETSSPFKVKASAPRLTTQGTLLEAGGVFGKAGIHASKDEGKTWEPLVEKALLGDTMWVLPTRGLFVVSNSAIGVENIQHSPDEGRTWTVEHSTFEKALYDAQTRKP